MKTWPGNGDLDGTCCEPDSGQCCGAGSWCCQRAGKHDHNERPVSAWDLLGIAPNWTGGMSTDEWVDQQRGRGSE